MGGEEKGGEGRRAEEIRRQRREEKIKKIKVKYAGTFCL
jgi:hypothetical protein